MLETQCSNDKMKLNQVQRHINVCVCTSSMHTNAFMVEKMNPEGKKIALLNQCLPHELLCHLTEIPSTNFDSNRSIRF